MNSDLLSTLSEIAVTVAALSAVAGAVSNGKDNPARLALLKDVALIGMFVALFSLLPILLTDVLATEFTVRLSCSVAAFLIWLGGYVNYFLTIDEKKTLHRDSRFVIGAVLTLAGWTCFASNLLFPSTAAWSIYAAGLLFWLAVGCLNFIGAVFMIDTEEPRRH